MTKTIYEIDQDYNITKTNLKNVNRDTLVKYNTSNEDNDVNETYYNETPQRNVVDTRDDRLDYYSRKTNKKLQNKFDACLKLIKSSIKCVALEDDDVCNDFVVVVTK